MTPAWNSKSSDPAASKSDLSKSDQLVVLLEGIHPSTIEALRHEAYTRIVTHIKALGMSS